MMWFNFFFFMLSRDVTLIKKIGAATALEVRATGIRYAFAPCIAVTKFKGKTNFRTQESNFRRFISYTF